MACCWRGPVGTEQGEILGILGVFFLGGIFLGGQAVVFKKLFWEPMGCFSWKKRWDKLDKNNTPVNFVTFFPWEFLHPYSASTVSWCICVSAGWDSFIGARFMIRDKYMYIYILCILTYPDQGPFFVAGPILLTFGVSHWNAGYLRWSPWSWSWWLKSNLIW